MPRSRVGDEHSKPLPSGVRCGFGRGKAWAEGEGGGGQWEPRRHVGDEHSKPPPSRVKYGFGRGRAWADGEESLWLGGIPPAGFYPFCNSLFISCYETGKTLSVRASSRSR